MGCGMGDSLSGSLSGNRGNNFDPSLNAVPLKTVQPSEPADLLTVLRKNLDEGLQPPAAILHATAETARLLTAADGVALAVRTKGLIVCRACSGDPTPDIGTPLDTNAGISGECLRADSILVCDDSESDPRVDPDVCRFLGIRSLAVVPLHGASGVAGILEAFSTRIAAFGELQVNSLRALAEIAETAYGREVRGLQESPSRPPKPLRIRMFSEQNSEADNQVHTDRSIVQRLWFIGTAVVAILLFAGVWLSGHEPSETSANEPAIETHKAQPISPTILTTLLAPAIPAKPKAGISRSDPSPADVLKNAAHIEVIEDEAIEDARVVTRGPASAETSGLTSAPTGIDAPSSKSEPTPETAEGTERDKQGANLAAPPDTPPALGEAASQRVVPGVLMHRVAPVYTAQAKAQHLFGTVELKITIAEDGRIHDVSQISGEPVLAAAATDAIRRWRYSPFLLDGKPVEVQRKISVVFKQP
jgi:TonB family protein